MAFTRFHDDPERIKKALEQTTYTGRYQINVPGQGIDLPFMEDTQIRLQGWGANLSSGGTDIESDLRGLTRKLARDNIATNDYKMAAAPYNPNMYPGQDPFVEESRATHPAWRYKDLEQTRWETPFLPPIQDIVRNPEFEVSSRKLAKDEYIAHLPAMNNTNRDYLSNDSAFSLDNGNIATVYNK
jgi:hypothetical protein